MRSALLITVLAATLVTAAPHGQTANGPLAIVGARLIDGTGAAPLDDAIVVVAGDRIVAAGARGRIQIPTGATVLDAGGKILMPGLVDVHCHINQPPDAMTRYWLAQLRWGVTTMRSAGNDKPETVPAWWALIGCSILIASMTTTRSPSSTS